MITLLSDFGLQDASVAVAKGILAQHISAAHIIDISHEIQPFNTAQAAYMLSSAIGSFPAGTCHLLLFDIFSGPALQLILCEHKGQFFLSSDSSLAATALGQATGTWLCNSFPAGATFHHWLHEAAKVLSLLQAAPPSALTLSPHTLVSKPLSPPVVTDDGGLKCDVVHTDQFGNVVINFTRDILRTVDAERLVVRFSGGEEVIGLSRHYNDVRPGYKLCRLNSNGYLEICVNRGNAATLFGLRIGGRFNDIKVYIP